MTRTYETIFWTGLVIVGIASVLTLIPVEVWAQALPADKIDTKFDELLQFAKKVAWGVAGIGAVVFFVRVMNGNPDAWGLGLKFLMGAIGIYVSADVISWLKA